MGRLLERKKRELETLEDVKSVSEEITRMRLEGEFTVADRATFSNINAEGVTEGTPVSEAARANPAEPGMVNVDREREGANALVDKKPDAKRTEAKK